MYEVWGRKRPVNGRGFSYNYISRFYNEEDKYFQMDQVDQDIYQEAMILDMEREKQNGGALIMFCEFNKPKTKTKKRKL